MGSTTLEMKGKWRHLQRNSSGRVSLTPEDNDDIWTLYNIISVGDEVECMTMRKVQLENSSGPTGDSQKIKLVLAVRVEKLEVDLVAGCLRVNGKNVKENKHVKLGSYHTLELECDRFFKLEKACWDPLALQMLEQSTSESGKYDVAAIVLGEACAFICTIADASRIRILKRVEEALPKKKIGSAFEKSIERYYEHIMQGMLELFDFSHLKAIILASPQTFREDLAKRMMDSAVKDEQRKCFMECKSKIIKVQTANATVAALETALQEPRIASLLDDTKTAAESKLLDQFQKRNSQSPEMVTYGWKHVDKAAREGAVKNLLLSDSLFRSLDVAERRKFIDLVEEVKDNGGSVQIFIQGTAPELELAKLTGVAAILNFPIDE